MQREEILAGVEKLSPWFHCIDLGQGIKTKWESIADEPVDHPQETWATIKRCLPEDLSGRSLLDVGCNAGFYAVEAKRRNAAHVLGIDAKRHHIRQAVFVRWILDLDIQYRRMSAYDLSPRTVGQFDITLALGLIYHCKHLMLALEKLFQVTKKLLIVESAILLPEKSADSFDHSLGGLRRRLHPLAYVENPLDAVEYAFNWFLPSPSCLQALLKNVGFHEVELFAVEGERVVFVCHKQDVYMDSRTPSSLAATLTLEEGPTTCHPASELLFRIWVENSGFARWLACGEPGTEKGAVRLGAHLFKEDEEEILWDYGRAVLKRDLAPGKAECLDIRLQAPSTPGKYRVEFDMVAEHVAWLEDFGSETLTYELQVE